MLCTSFPLPSNSAGIFARMTSAQLLRLIQTLRFWIKCRIAFHEHPHKHILSRCRARYVLLVHEKPPSVVELMFLFKRELSLFPVSLTPSFSFFFFFQVPIYLNSFPLFFFLLHWFPNPSLCMQLGPSCVSVTVYMCAYMCVCLCGFFWHSAATLSIAHCTQRTRAAKKRGKKRKRENRGKTFER